MHTFRVIFALAPYALSFLRDHRRWFWWGAPLTRSPEFHRRRADRLVQTIIALGPSFVKIAQVFATRADLVPEPYLGALGSLVDQVPPLPFPVIDAAIREAYGRGTDEVFEAFERQPVAAASLAQVHRARLNGEAVAVKVLRPGVEARVAADVKAARRILTWLDRWWGHPHIKRELTALAAFETRVREEVDFRQEAAYAIAIRKNFEHNDRVIIPRVHETMTRQRVLVMEFVVGTRLDRLDQDAHAHVDVKHVVQTLVELYIQMELIDGLFHADPHPGNVMLAPDGRLVLVDFGAVVRVPLKMRSALVHTSIAAIRRDVDAVAQGFVDMGLAPPGIDPAEIRWIAQVLIDGAYSRTTLKERIDTLLADRVMKTLFDSPMTLTEDAVYFARAAALIEGIGARYDPYFQVVQVASPVVLRMRSRILRSLGESVNPSVEEIATVAGYALGRAARWVKDRVAKSVASVALLALVGGASGCAGRAAQVISYNPAPVRAPFTSSDPTCATNAGGCASVAMRPEVARAIEQRIAQLAARGGDCARYGAALARSYAGGKITVRPYMWRANGSLASGTARDGGDMTLALDIDSLNVGVRTIPEILQSVEHEAVHLAFPALSREPDGEAAVDRRVRACQPSEGAK